MARRRCASLLLREQRFQVILLRAFRCILSNWSDLGVSLLLAGDFACLAVEGVVHRFPEFFDFVFQIARNVRGLHRLVDRFLFGAVGFDPLQGLALVSRFNVLGDLLLQPVEIVGDDFLLPFVLVDGSEGPSGDLRRTRCGRLREARSGSPGFDCGSPPRCPTIRIPVFLRRGLGMSKTAFWSCRTAGRRGRRRRRRFRTGRDTPKPPRVRRLRPGGTVIFTDAAATALALENSFSNTAAKADGFSR